MIAYGAAVPSHHLTRLAWPALPRTWLPIAALLFFVGALPGCTFVRVGARTAQSRAELGLRGVAWPAADGLFRQSRRWLGGDAASTVDLGGGKTLWLFGDSFVAERVEGDRRQARMIHNSVAIQTGYDPSRASLHQYWRTDAAGPAAFFAGYGDDWLWPLHGVRIGTSVTVFCIRARAADNMLGFESAGWTALRADGADLTPNAWVIRALPVPAFPALLAGGVSVVRSGGWVHAYAVGGPKNSDAFLMRWPESVFMGGDLSQPEWFVGNGWLPQALLRGWPAPVIQDVASEFSVSAHPTLGFVQVQSTGFPAGDLTVRFADRLEGPWTSPQVVYRPPETGVRGALVYAGKAHPHLIGGGDLIATYVASSLDFAEVVGDPSRYYPRFVRLTQP